MKPTEIENIHTEMIKINEEKRNLISLILQEWNNAQLPSWDKYDWAMYTSMNNKELQEALDSLKRDKNELL